MEIVLVIVNVAAGGAGAYALARHFRVIEGGEGSLQRQCGVFISVYLVESVSVVLGMGMPVFSVFLSFIWAAIFGMRLSKWESRKDARMGSFLLSFYTSLPVISLALVPIVALVYGKDVTSVDAGYRFGIPQFDFVPSAAGTILGFYAFLILGAFALKTSITMGGVALIGRKEREAA